MGLIDRARLAALKVWLWWHTIWHVDRQTSPVAALPCGACGFQWVTAWRETVRIMVPPSWWNHERPYPNPDFDVEILACTRCGTSFEQPC